MRFLSLLLLLVLPACSGNNLWQEIGIAPKPSIEITTPSIINVEIENESVDLMCMIGLESDKLSIKVPMPSDFKGNIISRQNPDQMNAMAEVLSTEFFSDDYMKNHLMQKISNKDILDAMNGNYMIIESAKNAINSIITSIPTILISDETIKKYIEGKGWDETEENILKAKSELEGINSYIEDVKKALIELSNALSEPIENSYLADTKAEYVRVQLITNVLAGFLDTIFFSYDEISSEINGNINLSDSSDLSIFLDEVIKQSVYGTYTFVLNLIKNMAEPLAVMDKIATRYSEIIGLPNLSMILKLIMGQ